jgi:hypothetical protein
MDLWENGLVPYPAGWYFFIFLSLLGMKKDMGNKVGVEFYTGNGW